MGLGIIHATFEDNKAAGTPSDDESLLQLGLSLHSLRDIVNSIGGIAMLGTFGYVPPQESFDMQVLLQEVVSLVRPHLLHGVVIAYNANGIGVVSGSRLFLKQVNPYTIMA